MYCAPSTYQSFIKSFCKYVVQIFFWFFFSGGHRIASICYHVISIDYVSQMSSLGKKSHMTTALFPFTVMLFQSVCIGDMCYKCIQVRNSTLLQCAPAVLILMFYCLPLPPIPSFFFFTRVMRNC